MTKRTAGDGNHSGPGSSKSAVTPSPLLERLVDLERRSLLAEQARQQAHVLRTPLSVIDLIAETLQLETEDATRGERLARIQGAATTLTTKLADMVRANSFGDGPARRCDVTALAAGIVHAFGGDVAAGSDRGDAAMVEPASFEAAVVHVLRLIGVGTDCNGVCNQRPQLHAEQRDGMLLLSLSALGDAPPDVPRERADFRLMAQAAERAAQDHGGRLSLKPASAVIELPQAETEAED
jgi:signal transduction histidine kinase